MRKNFRSDFTIEETFYAESGQNNGLVPTAVPQYFRIDYFTPRSKAKFTCSRNGETFHNCSLSQGGNSVICCLSLSRKFIGAGPLLKVVRTSENDSRFPDSLRNDELISSTGIDLWAGPSDAGEMESDSVLPEVIVRYGYSAYRLAVLNGFVGTEEEWLASLIGPQGLSAYQVAVDNGFVGTEEQWLASLIGPAGKSAYQSALDNGFVGSEADWLASLIGPAGDSAYEIAVEEGFVGTKQAWLASLVGPQGLSAYQVAVVEGFEGTVSEWLASLVGPAGPAGKSPYIGENGHWLVWDADAEEFVDSEVRATGDIVTAEDIGEAVQPINLSPNVQYVAQELTAEQKAQARENIGAGTSDFNGDYNSLENQPDIPDVTGKEDKTNKVTTIDAQSTDTQYPSAKAVHTSLGNFYTKEQIDEMMVSLKIPAEYQRVEYIQGDGAAYIDLGVNNKTTFGVRAKASGSVSVIRGFRSGACTGNMSGCGLQLWYSTVRYSAGESTGGVSLSPFGSENGKYVQANFYGSGKGFVEGLEETTTINPLGSKSYADTSYHHLIFAYNDYQGTVRGLDQSNGIQLCHYQITDGSALKFNLYPVYRKSDDEPGLYDIITKTFFPNANSSGAFTVGPNVN